MQFHNLQAQSKYIIYRGRLYKKVIKVNYNLVQTSSNKKRLFES
jgi:hypothetical protein